MPPPPLRGTSPERGRFIWGDLIIAHTDSLHFSLFSVHSSLNPNMPRAVYSFVLPVSSRKPSPATPCRWQRLRANAVRPYVPMRRCLIPYQKQPPCPLCPCGAPPPRGGGLYMGRFLNRPTAIIHYSSAKRLHYSIFIRPHVSSRVQIPATSCQYTIPLHKLILPQPTLPCQHTRAKNIPAVVIFASKQPVYVR